ncbi:MAG: ABC transporter permease [Candidatus Buchananbacteria bacterium]
MNKKSDKKNIKCKRGRFWLTSFSVCQVSIPFQIAIKAILRNKVRSVLTVLGIVIGIAAVITVMSAGDGFKAYVVGQVETFGTDAVQVETKVPNTGHMSSDNAGGQAMGIQITTLKIEDAQALKKITNIKNNYTAVIGQEVVSFESEKKQVLLWGISASFVDIDSTKVAAGRFFSDEEDKNLAQVAVVGKTVVDKIFNGDDPIGQLIKIGREKFLVIGVMEKRGSIAFFDMDNVIYIPVQTLQKKIMGIDHVQMIFNKVYDNSVAEETAEEIRLVLRQRHNIEGDNVDKDDFAVMTMTEALNIYNSIFGAINLLLICIAGISLVVGGIGIMNIMYVSVTERTYEIGLRKAMGATSGNILWQFLWEALVITFFGAIIGFGLGILFSYLISIAASASGIGWKFVISIKSIILATGVSFFIGLVFGVFPALAAAKLDPVTALRSNK